MSDSPFAKSGLFLMSGVLLAIALGTWTVRGQRSGETMPVTKSEANKNEDEPMRQRAQHAVALLFRAFHADNHLSYAAVSDTVAFYGGREMKALARVTRTPEKLSITYISGAQKGLQSGFNKRWFWRQNPGAPFEAYAEVQDDALDMAAKRFVLMLQNYRVQLKDRGTIAGRPVEFIELRPFHPEPGARGPYKSLAIDVETGLTLRVATFDQHAKPVMSTTLTKVDYTPALDAASFKSPESIMQAVRRKPWTIQDLGGNTAKVVRLTGLEPPKPSYLPGGFKFDSVGVHRCNYGGAPFQAALSRYTDGLNTLTIFAIKPKSAATRYGRSLNEASSNNQKNPLAQTISDQSASYATSKIGQGRACDFGTGTLSMRDTPQGRLVAVGDLPSAVLRRVLESADVLPMTAPSGNAQPNQAR